MKIQFDNSDGLYYKYKDILNILKEWKVELVDSSRTDEVIELDFKNEADYLKTYKEICIIPLDHEIVEA